MCILLILFGVTHNFASSLDLSKRCSMLVCRNFKQGSRVESPPKTSRDPKIPRSTNTFYRPTRFVLCYTALATSRHRKVLTRRRIALESREQVMDGRRSKRRNQRWEVSSRFESRVLIMFSCMQYKQAESYMRRSFTSVTSVSASRLKTYATGSTLRPLLQVSIWDFDAALLDGT